MTSIAILYEYSIGWGSLRFIYRKVVYKKSLNCSHPSYMSIFWVAIEFIPYILIFLLLHIVIKMNLRLK